MNDQTAPAQDLFRAKEVLRQVELRLAAQAAALATLEVRANSLIGWAMAGIVAAGAAVLAPATPTLLAVAAGGLFAGLAAAAVAAMLVLFPRDWGVPGFVPADFAVDWARTAGEADLMEWIAEGCGGSASANSLRLAHASRCLRWALCYLGAAPIFAAICAAMAALAA